MSNQNNKPLGKLEAEQSVLGSAMLSTDALAYAVANLTPAHFYGDWNRGCFMLIRELAARKVAVDIVTMIDEAERQFGNAANNKTGGTAFIADLQRVTPSAANHKEYVRIIKEYHAQQTGAPTELNPDAVDRTQALGLYDLAHREDKDSARNTKRHAWVMRRFPRLAKDRSLWPESVNVGAGEFVYPKIDLVNAFWDESIPGAPDRFVTDIRRTVLDEFSEQIAKQIQFPLDTTFAFGLGAIASSMARSFSYRMHQSDQAKQYPVTIYIVAAQPAGSGKSGVYAYFCDPIATAYDNFNISQKAKRAKIIAEIEGFKADLKKASNDVESQQLRIDIAKKQDELSRTPVYVYQVDDTTPEGLRDLAMMQDGLINIISDEADAVNTVLGAVYGDAGKKVNHGVFLKAWDGETLSVTRAGKEPMMKRVKGCIAIIAQGEAIDSVLRAGLSGRGISERCMIITEPSMVGYIDVRERMRNTMDNAIRAKYSNMINEIVADEGRVFDMTNEAREILIEYGDRIQKRMRPGGDLSDVTLHGVLSKAEKQLLKISSVLHATYEWSGDGARGTKIDDITMRRAVGIFDVMSRFYIAAAELHGYAGDAPKIDRVHTYLEGQAAKRKYVVSVTQIRDAVKGHDAFAKAGTSVASVLRDTILPKMEQMGRVVLSECKTKVYLSLKEYGA